MEILQAPRPALEESTLEWEWRVFPAFMPGTSGRQDKPTKAKEVRWKWTKKIVTLVSPRCRLVGWRWTGHVGLDTAVSSVCRQLNSLESILDDPLQGSIHGGAVLSY
jgi:hypothetical protein